MRPDHVKYLCCINCQDELILKLEETDSQGIKEGTLCCGRCLAVYPIIRHIPRFLGGEHNYSSNFGYQWNKHYRTQYDSYSGIPESEQRFFKETRWPRKLKGQLVLEAGSGSGRFTEHAASTGAMVVSLDYSEAVEANYRNNGRFENLLIVQASIYDMPFHKGVFDKVFCIGVLQHTPEPQKSFQCLAGMLAGGGNLVIDCYPRYAWWKQMLLTKYWVRPMTQKVPSDKLYKFCEAWVNFWWPITGWAQKITKRRALSLFLCIIDYRGHYPLTDAMHKEWSVLDTFDMLSPKYDYPKTIPEVLAWFKENGLEDIEVNYGYNGIEGRGNKPKQCL